MMRTAARGCRAARSVRLWVSWPSICGTRRGVGRTLVCVCVWWWRWWRGEAKVAGRRALRTPHPAPYTPHPAPLHPALRTAPCTPHALQPARCTLCTRCTLHPARVRCLQALCGVPGDAVAEVEGNRVDDEQLHLGTDRVGVRARARVGVKGKSTTGSFSLGLRLGLTLGRCSRKLGSLRTTASCSAASCTRKQWMPASHTWAALTSPHCKGDHSRPPPPPHPTPAFPLHLASPLVRVMEPYWSVCCSRVGRRPWAPASSLLMSRVARAASCSGCLSRWASMSRCASRALAGLRARVTVGRGQGSSHGQG